MSDHSVAEEIVARVEASQQTGLEGVVMKAITDYMEELDDNGYRKNMMPTRWEASLMMFFAKKNNEHCRSWGEAGDGGIVTEMHFKTGCVEAIE